MIIIDLSRNIIKRFVEVATPEKITSTSDTVYGTVVNEGDVLYVQIDGSSILTPVSSTIDIREGDRVLVLLKNHEATVLGSPTSPTARLEELEKLDGEITRVDILLADKVGTGELVAIQATIDQLEAKDVEISGELSANKASIEALEAENATINGTLTAYKADIENLEAETAKIENLEADVADINTLMFGSASGGTIQTEFSNAVIAQLGNAQIKSAMIDSLTADKITAGDIITNDVRVLSEDGKLLISDETIQISDNTRVRVQIGKDASNDYSINIWDAGGKLMFSKGGITDAAIKDAIIRNDMVSENANISASKLDISSLFTEINNSTETIKSTKIYLDDKNQTLDVAFTQMSSDINDISDDVTSQGTALSVVQGQISSKIWLEDIETVDLSEIEGSISTLTTQYSNLDQELDRISGTVAEHTTQIQNKADNSTVTEVVDRVANVALDVDGFKTEVSSTYATKGELDDTNDVIVGLTNPEDGLITQLNSRIDQTDQSWVAAFNTTQSLIHDVDDKIENVQNGLNSYETWFSMDLDGFTIGKKEDGEELPLQVRIDNDSVDFMDNDTVVAYVSNEKLRINAADIEGTLDVGQFRWTARSNGNMGLMWMDTNTVATLGSAVLGEMILGG